MYALHGVGGGKVTGKASRAFVTNELFLLLLPQHTAKKKYSHPGTSMYNETSTQARPSIPQNAIDIKS
jgi:hypothetical protein